MELKVKGKSVTSTKVKNFQNPFCSKFEIINKNYISQKIIFWLKPLQNKKGQKNLGYSRKKQSFSL